MTVESSSGSGSIKLCASSMNSFKVESPCYDRSSIPIRIVHFGVGSFHRSHQAVYLHKMLQQNETGGFGICGVGLLDSDKSMKDALVPQDCLYSLIEKDNESERVSIVGSILDYLHAPSEQEQVLARLVDPQVTLVTLTITEGGYCCNQNTGELQADLPEIQRDLATPSAPRSAFGFLAEALRRRRDKGIPPFTVLSCDNLQGNGDITKKVLLSFTEQLDPQLAAWIHENVAFPNCMVDRITPVTTDEHRERIRLAQGIGDAWPVVCEPFLQWIVEDNFCNDRPAWETVGVQMVSDVRPYELMKLRLLNASHSLLGYLGALCGESFINEVVLRADFQKYVRDFMDIEATPLLEEVPGIDLPQYKNTLIERFSNTAIKDQVSRICFDGSSKMPKFVLPTLYGQLKAGGEYKRALLCFAGWFLYLQGKDESGNSIPIEDPMADVLTAKARKAGLDPTPLLSLNELFDPILLDTPGFIRELQTCIKELSERGVATMLAEVNS